MNEMHCSQQICIPPMYPYVLRQYAKAAIRSQPADLLRWSTAYFRCLALNLSPPVKPRLEYPIPKDYYGLTPGWLKALMYQFQGNVLIPIKVLYDRWIGACLRHDSLITILCLGRFTEPNAIPWYRFIGLCTGFLTNNLTQTMILFCEIITEEPEGSSSMVPADIWIDVYTFLASIPADNPQILHNEYFADYIFGEDDNQNIKTQNEESLVMIGKGDVIDSEIVNLDTEYGQLNEVFISNENEHKNCADLQKETELLNRNNDSLEEDLQIKDEDDILTYVYEKESMKTKPDVEEIIDNLDSREIYLEAIPGIGAIVPPEIVKAAITYIQDKSIQQHGVILPRNIKHYSCPPLETISNL